jgi:hypothetical protein
MKWVLLIIVALLIASRTLAGALFFIAIAWLVRLDPKPHAKTYPVPSDTDKKNVKRVYNWLFLSPFITLPIFIISIDKVSHSLRPSINERVLAVLIPLIVHTFLLLGLRPKRFYVFRHTQQALFLIALRAGMASLAMNIGTYPGDGLVLFLLGNGSLWLFGTIWGRNQVFRSECWWMRRKGETIVCTIEQMERLSPIENIKHSKQLMDNFQEDDAVKHALMAFRYGDPKIKEQSVDILIELGEVELF